MKPIPTIRDGRLQHPPPPMPFFKGYWASPTGLTFYFHVASPIRPQDWQPLYVIRIQTIFMSKSWIYSISCYLIDRTFQHKSIG